MIVVLDYNCGKIFLYDEPEYTEEPKSMQEADEGKKYKSEQIEYYLSEEKEHQLSNCEWMISYEPIQNQCSVSHILVESRSKIKRI